VLPGFIQIKIVRRISDLIAIRRVEDRLVIRGIEGPLSAGTVRTDGSRTGTVSSDLEMILEIGEVAAILIENIGRNRSVEDHLLGQLRISGAADGRVRKEGEIPSI
jgi:hypothetical protein